MRFRDALALHTCPLLLRVGLAATFLWFGIPKFSPKDFSGSDAATLVKLGIGTKTVVSAAAPVEPKIDESPAPVEPEEPATGTPPAEEESPDSAQPPVENPSDESTPPDAEADESGTPPVESAQQPEQPTVESETPQTEDPEPVNATQDVEYTVRAKGVEGLTVMLHNAGHPYPRIFAWIAMLTETIGAGLLLIGLFSRAWGLGLAVAMGYAFVLTSLPQIHAHVDPAAGNQIAAFISGLKNAPFEAQKSAFFQLALFMSAWCIFIGGPGGMSLDRLILRGSSSTEE